MGESDSQNLGALLDGSPLADGYAKRSKDASWLPVFNRFPRLVSFLCRPARLLDLGTETTDACRRKTSTRLPAPFGHRSSSRQSADRMSAQNQIDRLRDELSSLWHVTRKLERELIEQVRDLRVENVALRHQISSLNSFIFPAVRPRTRSERLGDRRRSDEAWAKSWRVRWTGEAK